MKTSVTKIERAKVKCLLIAVCACFMIEAAILQTPANARSDVRDSMVKIYSVQNRPDYHNPWNMSGPRSSSGSGCVIDGNRILTNAHVISDQTFIQVRLHGQSTKYPARVLAVSHDADLALLTVDTPGFFSGVTPLKLGKLPQVQEETTVYGFPQGGDTLSTTKGVVSRIEHQRYSHSLVELLAGQLDAAINPGNSGGPVMVDGRIVGVTMQTLRGADNIGYMVPVPIIKHFLVDMEDGHYHGFPEDGIIIQKMENKSLKKMNKMKENQSGVQVISILPSSPATGKLYPGDVVLAIDGFKVADDATIEFRPKERTNMNYCTQQRQVGEDITVEILRDGKPKKIVLTLDKVRTDYIQMPVVHYDIRPTYYVYGGLVFSPLTLNYLFAWGGNWTVEGPRNLINYYISNQPAENGDEVVVIINILRSDINDGYQDFVNSRVIEVNGIKIKGLRDLMRLVEKDSDDPFVVFKTERGQLVVLNRQQVKEQQDAILEIYRIASDRSSNLKAPVNGDKLKDNEVANMAPLNGQEFR